MLPTHHQRKKLSNRYVKEYPGFLILLIFWFQLVDNFSNKGDVKAKL